MADYGIYERLEGGVGDKVVTEGCEHIKRDGGYIQKFMDKGSRGYNGFGEIYFSHLDCFIDRGWKCHRVGTSNLTVVVGRLEIVVASSDWTWSKFFEIGPERRICIPPGYWYRFRSGAEETSICNLLDVPFVEIMERNGCQSVEDERPRLEVDWSNRRLL